MGRRPSSVDLAPEDIRQQLIGWLQDRKYTQRKATEMANAALEEAGEELRLTKSSVNRFSKHMDEIGERMRHSREMADIWIKRLGAQPQGEIGSLVNEMLRTLSMEATQLLMAGELDAEALPGVIEMLRELALTSQRLERASSENVKRAAEIRRQERERVAEEVGKEAKAAGVSDETIAAIREKLMMGAASG